MAVEVQPATTSVVPTGPIETVRQPQRSSATLEDQAARTALYITNYDELITPATRTGHEYLDSDYRLSSAGAAASLKYANPRDLPSYPSTGFKRSDSAAGAAASLGWANQKPFELWQPDPSASASAAAISAKDYKMPPLWQPEQSSHGAKAALVAQRGGGKVDIWQPQTSSWGNSAASQALRKHSTGGLSPVLDYGYTDLGRRRSVMAASGAMSQGRKRAESTPVEHPKAKVETYPDEKNASANALRAATSASRRQRRGDASTEIGAVNPVTALPRDMYTSQPPVAPEVDELNRQNSLHASAVAMAKGMYNQQQRQFEAASNAHYGAAAAHARRVSTSTSDDEVQPGRFSNLQDAAQKLAQERLARLHDEHARNREYRDYYGSPQPTSRISTRGRARRRATSEGATAPDKDRPNKTRADMSLFSSSLSQVDAKKRQADREALIAAAQRNVRQSLHGMDERVFADTGKVAPSLLSEWELKAHAAAQEQNENRVENYGKVHIGGGKFVDQSEIDMVAQRNIQPVLDEINEAADGERERQAALKVERETHTRKSTEQKTRDKESKAINKKLKQQDKEEEKMRKAEEKAAKKEEARRAKEKRKSGRHGAQEAESAEEAVVTEPAATEPAATGPAVTGPAVTEPAATEPAVTEPAVTEPAATEPAATGPAVTEPAATGPAVTEHAATGPAVTEPAVTGPAATEPTVTEPAVAAPVAVAEEPVAIAQRRSVSEPAPIRTSMEDQASLRMRELAAAANRDNMIETPPTPPASPPGNKRVRNWFKSRFSRRKNRSLSENEKSKKEGFVGGAALTGASANNSTASLHGAHPSSVRDVAMAGRPREEAREEAREAAKEAPREEQPVLESQPERTAGRTGRRASEVSSVSTTEIAGTADEEEFQEARDNFDEALTSQPVEKHVTPVRDDEALTSHPVEKSVSPVRDSKFTEEI